MNSKYLKVEHLVDYGLSTYASVKDMEMFVFPSFIIKYFSIEKGNQH